jgi:hypothetical protein
VSTKGVEKLKTLGYLKHINFFSEPWQIIKRLD